MPTHFMFTTVLFDCDGTLVNSEDIAVQAIVDCTSEMGGNFSLIEARRLFVGSDIKRTRELIKERLGYAPPADFEHRLRLRMAAQFKVSLKPIPRALGLLQALKVPCAVVSNGPLAKMKLTLGLTGLAGFFGERLFSAHEVGIAKPDPGLYLHAAKALAVEPQHCLVVEDSSIGIESALNAGMSVLAYGGSFPQFGDRIQRIQHLDEVLTYV